MTRPARDALAEAQIDLASYLLDALDDLRPGQALTITRDAETYVRCRRGLLSAAIRQVKAAEPAAEAEWEAIERQNAQVLAGIET